MPGRRSPNDVHADQLRPGLRGPRPEQSAHRKVPCGTGGMREVRVGEPILRQPTLAGYWEGEEANATAVQRCGPRAPAPCTSAHGEARPRCPRTGCRDEPGTATR